jgi:hypothetical protein
MVRSRIVSVAANIIDLSLFFGAAAALAIGMMKLH